MDDDILPAQEFSVDGVELCTDKGSPVNSNQRGIHLLKRVHSSDETLRILTAQLQDADATLDAIEAEAPSASWPASPHDGDLLRLACDVAEMSGR